MLVGIAFSLGLGRIGWRYFIVGTSRKIETDIRKQLFEKWVTLDITYYNQNKTGNLMAYATNDINAVRMMLGIGVIILFDAIVLTVMVIVKMATYVDLRLTLLAILPMPIIAIGGAYFEKKVEERFDEKQQAFAKLSDKVQESLSGIRVIKAFVQEYYDLKSFEGISQENYVKNIRLTKLSAILNPLMNLLVGISIMIAIAYGGYLTMTSHITVGEFVAFNQYLLMLTWPMMAIAMAINMMAQGRASIKRIETVLKEKPGVINHEEAKVMTVSKGEIEIKNLSFDFPDNHHPGLIDINLKVEEGQTLAILGRTGSGKSTFVNLLLRLYNAPEESIFIDGQDIMKASLESVRKSIAYVPQDNFLFSDTVSNNIGFGLDQKDQDRIVEAAKKANVHDNIMDFPKQYETLVGERGTMLSGGQKQRIAIARAFCLNAPVLILDDSLSAVDTKTEEQILENLKQVRKGKTTLLIAHRISTVQHADQIVVLDEGKIIEQGNHESLMNKKGVYFEMNEQQKLEQAIHNA
jgi:ATP-binding cassette subfamily B protein